MKTASEFREELNRYLSGEGGRDDTGPDRLHLIQALESSESRVKMFEKDAAEAAEELLINTEYARPGTVAGKLLSANVILRGQRDRLKAEVERLTESVRIRDKVLRYVLFTLRGNETISSDLCDEVQVAADETQARVAELEGVVAKVRELESDYQSDAKRAAELGIQEGYRLYITNVEAVANYLKDALTTRNEASDE